MDINVNLVVGFIYFIISGLFAYNFNVIYQRIKKGSTKVNKYSLFATSSLVLIFVAEALDHCGLGLDWVLLAQIYLLWAMGYIIYSKKNN